MHDESEKTSFGEKVSRTLQLDFAAMRSEHSGEGAVPVASVTTDPQPVDRFIERGFEMNSAVSVPEFVIAKVCVLAPCPMTTDPNEMDDGTAERLPAAGVGVGVGEGYLIGPGPGKDEAGAGPTISTDEEGPKQPLNMTPQKKMARTREPMADENPPSARFSGYRVVINCGMEDTD